MIALDKIKPVKPPIVKLIMNPSIKNNGQVQQKLQLHNELSQLNTLIAVGRAITVVTNVKYNLVLISNPTVNIWCTYKQRTSNKEIIIIAINIESLPKIVVAVIQEITSLTKPNEGSIKM